MFDIVFCSDSEFGRKKSGTSVMKDRIQLQRIQLQNVWPCCWLSVSISWRAVHSSFVAAQVAPILKDEYHGYHAVFFSFTNTIFGHIW